MMAELGLKGTATPTQVDVVENDELRKNNTYNYPNPFESETTIRFVILSPKDVHIRVYDIDDKLVWRKDIPVAAVKTGLNTVIWKGVNDNGENAANGVYILEVATDEKAVKKLMALVRSAE